MNEFTFLRAADIKKAMLTIEHNIDVFEKHLYLPPMQPSYIIQIEGDEKLLVDKDCIEVLLKHHESKLKKLQEEFDNL